MIVLTHGLVEKEEKEVEEEEKEEEVCIGDLNHFEKVHVTCSCVVEACHSLPSLNPYMQLF